MIYLVGLSLSRQQLGETVTMCRKDPTLSAQEKGSSVQAEGEE